MAAQTRFLVIDDHPLFRDALQSAVTLSYPDADIFEAASIEDAAQILTDEPLIDLALLDLKIPGVRGYEGLQYLRTHHPRTPVVIVSGHEEDQIIREVLTYGAVGFIPKSSKKPELAEAIRQIMAGDVYVPASYQEPEANDQEAHRQEMIERISSLTPKQLKVLKMLQAGLLNKQIAYELQVGETTVKAHVSEILRKLQVISRTQAAIEAAKVSGEDLLDDAGNFTNSSENP